MARTNKYTSINFNHVLEKSLSSGSAASNAGKSPKQPPSSSYSSITSPNSQTYAARTHGRMLVLTKLTPKPISITPPLSPSPSSSPQPQQPQAQTPDRGRTEPNSDHISLRPLGRTGTSSETFSPVLAQDRDKEVGSVGVGSPKPNKFVPPHLRPGFVGRKERPGPEVLRSKDSGQKHFGSPGRYGEDGRPKSGGYERTRRGGESDKGLMSRPRSSGNRPSSSGSCSQSSCRYINSTNYSCIVKNTSVSGTNSQQFRHHETIIEMCMN
ncbi:putative Proteophosphoglycan-related [Melia azedarach]|uniref:Proteophosphoglycan-related n=1 Tax=Melia azedarach TaxID=155640 RepID=A0ACC1Z1U9_MELAZ|nr:putative Proteophosphoglycan-related [Melia azedarach]